MANNTILTSGKRRTAVARARFVKVKNKEKKITAPLMSLYDKFVEQSWEDSKNAE